MLLTIFEMIGLEDARTFIVVINVFSPNDAKDP